jgi:hypothetical protein
MRDQDHGLAERHRVADFPHHVAAVPAQVGDAHVALAEFLLEPTNDSSSALIIIETRALHGTRLADRIDASLDGHVHIIEVGGVRHDDEALHSFLNSVDSVNLDFSPPAFWLNALSEGRQRAKYGQSTTNGIADFQNGSLLERFVRVIDLSFFVLRGGRS